MKEKDILEQIEKLNSELNSDKNNCRLLHLRAELFTKIQNKSKAINDYLTIIKIDPKDEIAMVKLDMLKTIVKYTNTDIYANPNTNLDPWMD